MESDFDVAWDDAADAASACILQATSEVEQLCFDSIDHALAENDEFPVWERVVVDPVLAAAVLSMENMSSAILRVRTIEEAHAIAAVMTDYNSNFLAVSAKEEALIPEADYCDSPY